MSYEAYFRKKLKEFVMIKGPPPSRDASEITIMNAQRAAGTAIPSVVEVKESQPKLSQYYGSNPSEVSFSCEATVVKGGSDPQTSAESVLARKVSQTICCADEKVPHFVKISPTVYQKLFYPTEINSFYVWFDATDARTLFSDTVTSPATGQAGNLAGSITPQVCTKPALTNGPVTAWRSKDGQFQAQLPDESYGNNGANPIRTASGIAFHGNELSIYNLFTGELGISVNSFLASGFSVFLVAQTDRTTGSSTVFLDREGNDTVPASNALEFGPTFVSTNGSVRYQHHTTIANPSLPTEPSTNDTEIATIPGTAGGKSMFYFDRNNTVANVYVNGSPIATGIRSVATQSDLKYTTFGRRKIHTDRVAPNKITTLDTPSYGTELYELYIFRTVLSTEERNLMEGFLATKHGFTLPYTHPYYWIPVLETPFQRLEDTIEKPCKTLYKPGIIYTGGPQIDPYRGNTKPVFARNKNCSPSACSESS